MAHRLRGFQTILWLLFLFCPSTFANLPSKCTIIVGKSKYSITNWTWKVVEYKARKAFYINVCGRVDVKKCKDSAVCSTSLDGDHSSESVENLGSKIANKTTEASGFRIEYRDGVCSGLSADPKTWKTTIFMRCGKFLGSPQYVDISVGDKECVAVFEFVTNEACKGPPTPPEMPCSLYSDLDNKRRDLTPLIKLKGGYEVASSIPDFDFFINVCRGITAIDETQGCPPNSSMCRVDKKLSKNEDIGSISFASKLSFLPNNDIVLVYNTTQKVSGCVDNPVTTITFRCPGEMADKGPVLTAARDCRFEVFWETEFACPEAKIMSTDNCTLVNEFVNFDLTKLSADSLENYKLGYDVMEKGKKTHYIIYMNVCKPLGFPCGGRGTNSTVCQAKLDGATRYSLGDISKQTLRFADRHLTLIYEHGDQCSNKLNRTTIIMFICDYHVDKGQPVFTTEYYCFYYFEWRTKYACAPSRRTGTQCRVEGRNSLRFDLSELVRMNNQSNWVGLDGETSSSDRKIFLNVCGGLTFIDETRQCDRTAAVCMIEKGTVVSLGRYTDPPTLNQDNSIKLVYTQGSECKKDNVGKSILRNSTITFICQPGDLASAPVLVSHSEDNCHYEFMWETAAACSLGVKRGTNCKVQDKDAGYVFDLTPLAEYKWGKNDSYLLQVDKSVYSYQLKICGGSNQTSCPGGNIGACQIKRGEPTFHKTLGKPNDMLIYYDGMLNLTYRDGEPCHNGVNRTMHITFLCNNSAVDNGIGVPEYEKEDHCVYNFRWFTKYACLTKIAECIARSGSDQYDLTSLVKTIDNWHADGDGGTFYINVCRMLNLSPTISGCSGTASVCLVKQDGSFVNLGTVSDSPSVETTGRVTITYTSGDKCSGQTGKLYQSKITFICREGLTSSPPKFIEKEDHGCTYKFEWQTAAACKIVNAVGDFCFVKDRKSDTTFNLLPLMKQPNKGVYNGSLTDGKERGKFELNICGAVPECKGENKAGACLTIENGNKIVLGKFNKRLEYKGEIVTLVYKEGDNFEATGQQREVHINFYCNHKKPLGEPHFTNQLGNKYFFDFQTSLVCPASAVECFVRKGNLTYDLTPLGLIAGNWEAVDSRSEDKHLHYFINVCRSVNINSSNELAKCPGGAIGACQIDHLSDKGFNLGYVQSDPQITDNGDLTLLYSGGSECHHQYNRSIRIVFSCSNTTGSPIFVAESLECEYLFTWQTPSACALTIEEGDNCTVEDKQYGYMFDLSRLHKANEDYNVNVSGVSGVRIILNVCSRLVSSPDPCKNFKSSGACIIKDGKAVASVNSSNHLMYFNGQINMTYGKPPGSSVNFIFECDQERKGSEAGPKCERKSDNTYECHWPTPYACRPMTGVQCSIRIWNGKVDSQYDYSSLSRSTNNWQAQCTSPFSCDGASYFINVCRTVLLNGGAVRCSPTAGICMVKGGKAYNLGSIKRGPVKEGSNIYLKYEDGDDCGNSGKKYSSQIHMQCGIKQGRPMFVRKSDQTCLYEFLWVTSAACPVNVKKDVVSDNCKAVNPQTNVEFDLNVLRNTIDDYTVRDEKNNRTYYVNVCGPLQNSRGCNSNSGVCQVGTKQFSAGLSNNHLHFDDGVLYLNLSGGDDCHHVKRKRQTIISFVCSSGYSNRDDYGLPVFISEDDCTYYIMWHTPVVCERQYECAAITKGKDGSRTVKYSLGRLMRSDANWLVTTEGGVTDPHTIYVNLCRPLLAMPGKHCPAGAWACGIGDPIWDLGSATDPPEVVSEGEVRLVYKGKTQCKLGDDPTPWQVHFTFICSYGSLGHPVLESVSKDSCIIRIRWLTSAACGDEQIAELDKCRVHDYSTGEYYDLNRLSTSHSGDVGYHVVGEQSAPKFFFISLCRGLEDLNRKKYGNNCAKDGGAGVCLVRNQKVSTALGLYKNRAMTYYKDEGMLILTYCSKNCSFKGADNIKSRIIFVCDKKVKNGDPVLDTLASDGADFIWKTSLVCPPPEEECSFRDDEGRNYDLRLLTSRTRSWYYEHKKYRFWINICRGIEDGPKGCPSTASVCMIRKGTTKVNIVGVTNTQKMSVNDGKLQLRYTGLPPVDGCDKNKNSKVVFYFECGNSVGQPEFKREDWPSCSFVINWKSSVACQIKRKKLEENNCVVKHPVTGAQIDFRKLVSSSGSTWTITGINEDKTKVDYKINVCGKVTCNQKEADFCYGDQPLTSASRKFFYDGSFFSMEMTTSNPCRKAASKHVVVINFQCSAGEKVGSPKFEYFSSDCHHVFSWPTSIVCAGDLSQNVTDIPAVHKSRSSSAAKNVGIAFSVVFAVVLVLFLAIIFHKRSRRHSIISCVRWNFKRHILRQEIKYPVYRYQKLNTIDDDEVDSLIKEAEGSDEEQDDDEDDDILPF